MTLTFDDNNKSNELAAKTLYELGVQWIFLLNDSPTLKEEVEMLLKYKQIIWNHTATHRNMNNFTEEDFNEEVLRFNEKLEAYAWKVEWFSYPYSQRPFNKEIQKKLNDLFPNILRGSETPDTCENDTWDILRLPAKLYNFRYDNVILQLHWIDWATMWDIDKTLWNNIVWKISQSL